MIFVNWGRSGPIAGCRQHLSASVCSPTLPPPFIFCSRPKFRAAKKNFGQKFINWNTSGAHGVYYTRFSLSKNFNIWICIYTLFVLRTSKFCRDSLFLIFWLLQPQFVLNFVLISVSGLKWEIKTKRQGIEKQCWSIVWGDLYIYPRFWSLCFCPLYYSLFTDCRSRSLFLLPNDFTRFSKVSTRNIFTLF